MQQKHLIPHVNFYSCHKWCFRYIFVILFAFDFVVKSLGFVIHQEIMYLCRNKFWNIELLSWTWWAKIYTSEKYVASFVLWVRLLDLVQNELPLKSQTSLDATQFCLHSMLLFLLTIPLRLREKYYQISIYSSQKEEIDGKFRAKNSLLINWLVCCFHSHSLS